MSRFHALDALRAAMMLLGIVLHAAANYTVTPLHAAWPYQDAHQFPLFDLSLFLIHLFRMPVFFVMAGFFAAFVYARDGAAGFLWHRVRRLLLPLAIAWPIIFPLTKWGFVYATSGGGTTGLNIAMQALREEPWAGGSLVHLWFIWQLFLLSAAATLAAPLVMRLPAAFRTRVVDTFARLVPTWRGCLLLGAVTTLTLLPMVRPELDTSVTLLPAVRVLVAYAVFFTFGWLLYLRRDLVPAFARTPWRFIGVALILCVVHLVFLVNEASLNRRLVHLIGIATAGPAMWLTIYGIAGLFLRRFESPRPLQRYLSDASYWMYILHLPFVIALAGLLSPLPWPAVVKFSVVLAATVGITLVTYHFFVRSTLIGVLLNGRRFPRAMPRPESP